MERDYKKLAFHSEAVCKITTSLSLSLFPVDVSIIIDGVNDICERKSIEEYYVRVSLFVINNNFRVNSFHYSL